MPCFNNSFHVIIKQQLCCYVIKKQVLSFPVIIIHVMSCYNKSSEVISCYSNSSYVMPCYINSSCHVISRYINLCYVISCYNNSYCHHVIKTHVLSCYETYMLWYMSCCLHCVMPCICGYVRNMSLYALHKCHIYIVLFCSVLSCICFVIYFMSYICRFMFLFLS